MLASSSCSPPPLSLLTTVSTTTKTQTLTLARTQIQTRTRSISQSDPLRYCSCGRRHLFGAGLLLPLLPSNSQAAEVTSSPSHIPTCVIDKFYPPKADWYEEFYAQATDKGMISYEAEIAGYKKELFGRLAVSGKSKNIVEVGVGIGANFKYYASAADFNVIGVDPNKKMEKYAGAAAVAAGLPTTNFTFIRGVGEALPIGDDSMDAVIGTLVLCSVKDVDISLKGSLNDFFLFLRFKLPNDVLSKRLLWTYNPLHETFFFSQNATTFPFGLAYCIIVGQNSYVEPPKYIPS